MSIAIDWGNVVWWIVGILALLAVLAVLKFVLKVAVKILAFGFLALFVLVAILAILHYFGAL
jgi:hypothetical protein